MYVRQEVAKGVRREALHVTQHKVHVTYPLYSYYSYYSYYSNGNQRLAVVNRNLSCTSCIATAWNVVLQQWISLLGWR